MMPMDHNEPGDLDLVPDLDLDLPTPPILVVGEEAGAAEKRSRRREKAQRYLSRRVLRQRISQEMLAISREIATVEVTTAPIPSLSHVARVQNPQTPLPETLDSANIIDTSAALEPGEHTSEIMVVHVVHHANVSTEMVPAIPVTM